jgi:outer membrane protein OmpA-like peptidoglycan-associated protein
MTIRNSFAFLTLSMTAALVCQSAPATGQSQSVKAVVNSDQDTIAADNGLTLREAIALVNGTLTPDKLSAAEQSQVQSSTTPRIEFNLPAGAVIKLESVLPAITQAGTTVDGTTQPGYQGDKSTIAQLPMPMPMVSITVADGKEVFRGLTITADDVTIRGLSLYGFTQSHKATATTPPADIFVSHKFEPPNITKQKTPANFSPFYKDDLAPKNVVIEQNWLGLPPNENPADNPPNNPVRSAFGVSVFHGEGTVIRRNYIANHDGSGIITSVSAKGMLVSENVILGNGVAGMPDAIRLEGDIDQSVISGNLMCANDGAGVYLFKPTGSTKITDNSMVYNGRRLRRGAVYLMGNNHQVTNNQIHYQAGSGVVVTAYPKSNGNVIQNNKFSGLEGLSIDLVNTHNDGVFDYQKGDGINPLRNTDKRRKDTGNSAINAPVFSARAFPANSTVEVSGAADPGSTVDLYKVSGPDLGYGPLGAPVGSASVDSSGNFTASVGDLQAGDQVTAIATHPNYGTSEPARNARIGDQVTPYSVSAEVPRCVTPPVVVQEPPPPPAALKVPKVIHFALDRDNIGPRSAVILDRIAEVLRANPAVIVDIVGHTDPRASDAYNQDLGLRRARSARNYLLNRGVTPERMTIRSLGEKQRLSGGSDRLDYARDRRVEFDYQDAQGIEITVQEDDLQIEP